MKCFSADHACAEKHEEHVRNIKKHKEGRATAQKSSIKCCSNPGIISKALPHHGHVGLVWLVVAMHCLPSICCFAYARRSSQLFVLYLVALTMGNLFEKRIKAGSLFGEPSTSHPRPANKASISWAKIGMFEFISCIRWSHRQLRQYFSEPRKSHLASLP